MNDFFPGAIAGCSQILVGHPLDTLKVLIQNNQSFRTLKWHEFYRGFKYPLISSILFNSAVFTIYEKTLTYTNSDFFSGAMSGFCVSPFLFLFDIGKIKRQINKPFVFQDLYKTKGLGMTFSRETTAMSIYFGVYNYCVREWNISPFFAGGMSGLANWTVTYPLDVIRTRQMARNCSLRTAYLLPGSLWNGYTVCAIRAVLVNATVFSVYEKVKKIELE
tara:strand:- start:5193 stop:5849 length:657 start_codon:yes stop_codon:yes gene_type:complete